MSNSLQPHGLGPARLLCPWDSLGKNTGVVDTSSSRDLPNPGIKPASSVPPALAGRFFDHWATWEARKIGLMTYPCILEPKLEFCPWIFIIFVASVGLHCFAGALCSHGEQAASLLWRAGFSLGRLLLLCSTDSRHTGFSSHGTQFPWL